MEKVCEFCTAFKPVVYCKADAASLCLSCDSKVHSANALSSRHLRTLLCDSCRFRPCGVRCLDHGMFFCHVCDSNLHGVSSQHQRRVVSCYTGCPSAKDFVVMWGVRVNDDNAKLERRYGSDTFKGCSKMMVSFDGPDAGSSARKKKGKRQRETGFILEQILELEKLQLGGGNGGGSLLIEEAEASASISNVSDDRYGNSSNILPQSEERVSDLPQLEKDLMVDFSQSPFPRMEPLSSSSTADNSFWQCKGTSKSYQLWYQNLQDIGVCEETESGDGFDIPDIDLTFQNFEEVFGADQEPVEGLADDNMISSVSSVEMGTSLCKSDKRNPRAPEDASAASSFISKLSAQMKRDPSPHNGSHELTERTEDPLLPVKPAVSRFSGGSSGTNCHYNQSEEVSYCSPLSDNARLGGHQNAVSRLKGKKKARTEEKQTHYIPRKARSDARKRTSRRFVLRDSCSSDTIGVTRSY